MKKSRKKGPSSKIVFSLASKLSTFFAKTTEMTLETFLDKNFHFICRIFIDNLEMGKTTGQMSGRWRDATKYCCQG